MVSPAAVNALTAVQRAKIVRRLESAVFRNRLAPGNVRRAGYVASALRAFLRQVGRSHQLTAELCRRANIHQGDAPRR